MKNTNTCPKCQCNDIVRVRGRVDANGSANSIQVGMTIFSAVLVNRHICCNCGYSEEWIDKEDISKLEKRYK